MTMNIVRAAYEWLAASDDLTDLLGNSTLWGPWIFQGVDETSEPYVAMEGTSAACVMVWQQGGWSAPNTHNTMKFPKLNVEVYLDPPRDAARNVIDRDVVSQFQPIWDQLDKLLHRPQGGDMLWGTRRVLGSHAQNGAWDIFPNPDTDGVKVSRNSFAITTF
jgi:hypothetical protein